MNYYGGQENTYSAIRRQWCEQNLVEKFDTMPEAQSYYKNKIVMYVGSDTEEYIRGYFYLCKYDEGSGEYAWTQTYVQPSTPLEIGDTLNQDSGSLEANIGGIQTQQLNYVTRAAGSATPTSTDKVVLSNMTYAKPRDYGQQAYVKLLIDGVMRGAYTIPYAEQTSSYSKTFSEPYEGITGMFIDFDTPSNSYYTGTLDTSKLYGMEIQQIYSDNLERTAIDAHWLPLNWNQFIINSSGGISLRDSLANECLPLSGGTMSGEVDMDSNSIVNLPAPSDNGDAVNKDYVDNALDGYLPLTGGTLTNSLTIKKSIPVLNLQETGTTRGDIYYNDNTGHAYACMRGEVSGSFAIGRQAGDGKAGGTTAAWYNGPAIILNESGSLQLRVTDEDGGTKKYLLMRTDGTLTFDNQPLFAGHLYFHNLYVVSGTATLQTGFVINTDSTAFTVATFAEWLYDNGFTSMACPYAGATGENTNYTRYVASTSGGDVTTKASIVTAVTGWYSTDGSTLKCKANWNESWTINSAFNDKVITIF